MPVNQELAIQPSHRYVFELNNCSTETINQKFQSVHGTKIITLISQFIKSYTHGTKKRWQQSKS